MADTGKTPPHHKFKTMRERSALVTANLDEATTCYVEETNRMYVWRAGSRAWIGLPREGEG